MTYKKTRIYSGLLILILCLTNSLWAQVEEKPEETKQKIILELQAEAAKDWEHLNYMKAYYCDFPEECNKIENSNLWEYSKFQDKVYRNRSRLAETFLDKYPTNEHYHEALNMFLSIFFEPLFIPKTLSEKEIEILTQFPDSLLKMPSDSKEVSKFYRSIPIDKSARDQWLKKGEDFVAKVLVSDDTSLERKVDVEQRLLGRDMSIARKMYLNLNLQKTNSERNYKELFDAHFWEPYRLRLQNLLYKYPDVEMMASFVPRFIEYITADHLSPALAVPYWNSFYKITDHPNPLANRIAFKSLHKIATENLSAMGISKALDNNEPLEMKFTDMKGNKIDLSTLRGKVVLIDFWSISCAPCIAEMPHVQTLYDKYSEQGFEVIGIAANGDSAKNQVLKILEKTKATWPQRLDKGEDAAVSYHSLYNIGTLPTVWLLDKDGKIVDKKARGARLEPLIRKYLGLEK